DGMRVDGGTGAVVVVGGMVDVVDVDVVGATVVDVASFACAEGDEPPPEHPASATSATTAVAAVRRWPALFNFLCLPLRRPPPYRNPTKGRVPPRHQTRMVDAGGSVLCASSAST